MKKILFIAFLLIPFIGFSQTTKPIDGVLGIKFGCSKAAFIAAIKAKGGVIDKAHTNASQIAFKNIKFGQHTPLGLAARFFNDKFYFAILLFKADLDPKTIEYYDSIVADLNDVYGAGTPTKTFSSGFADGDGNEVTAIEGGYAQYATDWGSDNNNSIHISINNNLLIMLSYQDGDIRAKADAKQASKDKADY